MKRKQILLSAMCLFSLSMSLAHAGQGRTTEDKEATSKVSVRGPKRDQEIIGQPQSVILKQFLGFHLGQSQNVLPRLFHKNQYNLIRDNLQLYTPIKKLPYTPTYASLMDSTPKNPKNE